MSKQSVAFHAESDDYFATLATIMVLVREDLNNIELNTKILSNLVDDLMFLQEEYRIVKK